MKIEKISIVNLRNHYNTFLEPDRNLNIFFGPNGSGKTSILEAISIGCLTKTFTSTPDFALINENEDFYQIQIEGLSHLGLSYRIKVDYAKGQKKSINNTFGENQIPKDILGIVPLVYLSPDQKNVTNGAPENRREFIDRILSQSSKTYLDLLFKFRKTLKQRNSLLTNFKKNEFFDRSVYDSWTKLFIDLASQIILRRFNFIDEFNLFFKKAYAENTNKSELVELIYSPHSIDLDNVKSINQEEISEQLFQKSQIRFSAELARGITLFGPQKDDILIMLNHGIAKEKASQGQHKSLLIALIFAEFDYLLKYKDETPIVLLDDIFSELDEFRASLVLEKVLEKNAQTFVTLTNPDFVKNKLHFEDKVKFFKLENGKVKEE